MSVLIQQDKCHACGRCIEACPGNLIWRNDESKAYIRSPEDCWGCASCLKECKFGAICLYLGVDIGGRGGLMHTVYEGDLCHWIIESPEKEAITITVDRRNANKY